MSEELKRKLHDIEVTPPEEVWNRVSAALHDEIFGELPQRLSQAEEVPPANSWNKIISVLDNEIPEKFPASLFMVEVNPPARVWEKVLSALDLESTRVTSNRRILSFVKYAVAASFIGALILGGVKLFSPRTPQKAILTKVNPKSTSPNLVPSDQGKNISTQITSDSDNNLPRETVASRKVPGSKKKLSNQMTGGYMTQAADLPDVNPSLASADFQQANLSGNIPGSESWVSQGDRYLLFMNPDGYLIRISKKLAEALGCFYTNGNSEEYKQCQEQIKKWRDKIAQSPASSSPDNFMDLLDIIKSMQENEL